MAHLPAAVKLIPKTSRSHVRHCLDFRALLFARRRINWRQMKAGFHFTREFIHHE
jgi:hypothetical protein